MKPLLFLWFCFLSVSVFAQKKFNKVLLGKIEQGTFSEDAEIKQWFLKEYSAYKVNDSLVKILAPFLSGKKIVVVLGTWCSDSQREFPRLIRILETINFPMKNLEIYGMNRKKTRPVKIVRTYSITNVPTIVVLKGNVVVGRIIEKPKVSLEYDLSHYLIPERFE